jgi:two-component SAPR family response regulator
MSGPSELEKHLKKTESRLLKRLGRINDQYENDMSKLIEEYNHKYYANRDFNLTKDQIESFDKETGKLFTKLGRDVKKSSNRIRRIRERIRRISMRK